MLDLDWRVLLRQAGNIVESTAGSFGPLPGAVATFGVNITEQVIDDVVSKKPTAESIQGLEDACLDFIQELKTGQKP